MGTTTKTMPRAWVLACCAICGGITGAIYMWSIFRNPLVEATGMDVSTVTFAYSFFLISAVAWPSAGSWWLWLSSRTTGRKRAIWKLLLA